MVLPNLASWIAPKPLSKNLSETSTTFDIITTHTTSNPHPLFDEVLEHVLECDGGRYWDPYKGVTSDVETGTSRILVALNSQKEVIGSVILIWVTGGQGKLEKYMPWIRLPAAGGGRTGGIIYPVVQQTPTRRLILEGLIAIAVRHFQVQQQQQGNFERCVLDCIDDQEDLQAIITGSEGAWEIWQSFDEMQCFAADWKSR